MLLFSVPFSILSLIWPGVAERDFLGAIYTAVLPLVVSFAIVLPCALLIGLPVAFILRRRNAETMRVYILTGALFGFAVPFVPLVAFAGANVLGLSTLGAFSGAATAWSWSKARAQSSAATLNAD